MKSLSRNRFQKIWLIVPLLVILQNCDLNREYIQALYGEENYSLLSYDLANPDSVFLLHRDLTEISGLSYHPSGNLLAIQDEQGYLFIVNPSTGEVVQKTKFGPNGDYEGVEYLDGTVFILKSNGRVIHFPFTTESKTESIEVNTPLNKVNDAEGLGLNLDNSELLIACKGHPSPKGKESKIGRSVFGFSLEEEKLDKSPRYNITRIEIQSWISDHEVNHLSNIQFRPSGIAIHPITNDIYILSNIGKLLLVINDKGEIKGVFPLSPSTFRQPEGICFDETGTLFISNEGKGRRGNLMVFSPKQPFQVESDEEVSD